MAEKLKVSQSANHNYRPSRKETCLRKKVKSLQEAVDKCYDLMSAETFAQATEQASSIPADLLKSYNSKQETPEQKSKV
jgi:hypothetical protein